jgi:hypothetical protein
MRRGHIARTAPRSTPVNKFVNAAASRLAVYPLVCLACLATLPFGVQAAEASGHGATEQRTVPAFTAIEAMGPMDLQVRQGPQQALEVQADNRLLPLLETVVETSSHGATLRVRWKRGERVHLSATPRVRIVVPQLTAIAVAGSGDVSVESLVTPTLSLVLSGSGDIKLAALETADLAVTISGSGDVEARGAATRVKVSIAGSGDARLADLRADEVSVRIAGSGDAAVHASKSLQVSVAGSGDVTYTGNPTLSSSVAGSGSVRKR